MPDAVLIVLVCLTPFAVMSLLFWLISIGLHRWRYRHVETNEIHCATCRYNLRVVATWNCPECGSDLRTAGVLSREIRHPFPLTFRLLLAVYLTVALSFLLWVLIAYVTPQVHVVEWYCGFTTDYVGPKGRKERWVRLNATGLGNADKFHLTRATIGYNDSGPYFEPIAIDLESYTMSFLLKPGASRSPHIPVNYEELYGEFTRLAYNTSDEKKHLMVQDALAVIEAARSSIDPDTVNTHFRSSGDIYPSRMPIYEYNLLSLFIGLFFVFIVSVVVLKRFRMRKQIYHDERTQLQKRICPLNQNPNEPVEV